MNTKAELLTALINQKIGEIVGMGISAENLLESLMHNDLLLDGIDIICSFDGRFLQFTANLPEKQNDLDTRIEIKEAVKFIRITLNQIYQNEQLQEQLN